jgi:hypothetical protein
MWFPSYSYPIGFVEVLPGLKASPGRHMQSNYCRRELNGEQINEATSKNGDHYRSSVARASPCIDRLDHRDRL